MKCLETRRRNGMRWRRYRTLSGVIWTTYEVPTSVLSHLPPGRLAAAIKAAAKRLEALEKNATARAMLEAGEKAVIVAEATGLSLSQVRSIRRGTRGANPAPLPPRREIQQREIRRQGSRAGREATEA